MSDENTQPAEKTAGTKMIYEAGDKCWIAIEPNDKKLVEGLVLLGFKTHRHTNVFYIIEVADSAWPHLEIRDALIMSDTPEGPLPIWKQNSPSNEGIYVGMPDDDDLEEELDA